MSARFTYNSEGEARPHVHPLRTPSGFTLTRNAPEDHPWHHALWFTIKFVDGDNFWEELSPFGLLHQRDDHHLDWVRPDGHLALREERVLTEVDLGDDAWALDWSTVLEAPEAVVLDRTPFTTWGGYGGLSLRGSAEWTDTRLLLSDGTSKRRITGT
ncbi:MAG: PmoA family protein, partial [Acidimicrobiia bacterium]|nr:PmoA family protein [Acidimicrobiia bacterium]